MRHATLAVAAIAAGLLAGCGISDPYNDPDHTQREPDVETRSRPPATGDALDEAPELLRKRDRHSVLRAGRTPGATLRLAADLYGNWSSETAPRVVDQLVAISDGGAEADVRGIAGQARTSVERTAAGVRSEATLEALEVRGEGDRRSALIVTRERVTGEDLPAQSPRYRVTLAEVERRGDRWVITKWEPQA